MKAAELGKNRVVLIMSGVMLGVLMSALDSTIVGTAMPRIIRDLKGMEHYSWPFTSYMLLSTVAIPVFGKLADIYGRKIVYLTGLLVFLCASLLCGLSQNMVQLILFRGLQGVGGGILISNAFAVVGELFPPRERGKYIGAVSSMFGLANILGPAVGGLITDALNWHWIFYVNVPLVLAAMAIVAFALPGAIEHREKRVVDYAGIAALLAAFLPMLLAFSWAGRDYAWLSPQIVGLLGFSAVMLAAFIFIESRVKEPILPLRLFRNRTFNIAIAVSFLANAAMFGSVIFIPLFVQGVTGSTATASGLITTPMMLSFVIGSIAGGQIISRTGKYKALSLAGFVLGLTGMALLSTLTADTPYGLLVAFMVMLGFGLGINTPIFNITAQNAFPVSQIGVTTSSVQFFRNIGGTIGSAIFGSVMLSGMAARVGAVNWGGAPDFIVKKLNDPKLLANPIALQGVRDTLPQAALPFFDSILLQVKVMLAGSIRMVFVIGIFVVALAFAAALFMKEEPFRHPSEDKPVESCDNC